MKKYAFKIEEETVILYVTDISSEKRIIRKELRKLGEDNYQTMLVTMQDIFDKNFIYIGILGFKCLQETLSSLDEILCKDREVYEKIKNTTTKNIEIL